MSEKNWEIIKTFAWISGLWSECGFFFLFSFSINLGKRNQVLGSRLKDNNTNGKDLVA